MVKTETTAIFRCSDGRRYLTKRAAVKHEAWVAFKAEIIPEGDGEHGMYYTDEQLNSFALCYARVKAAHGAAKDAEVVS